MERSIEHVTFHVKGMTCASCEQRIQKAVAKHAGVISVRATQALGRVDVDFEPKLVSRDELSVTIDSAGYTVLDKPINHLANVASILGIGALMIALYVVINAAGGFNFLPKIDSSIGLAMIFVAGLLTSVHCVAMCGGIALSQQAKSVAGIKTVEEARRVSEKAAPSGWKQQLLNQKSGGMYHLGRIISYTVLGGVVGAIGSVISFSPLTKGILAGVAGLFMVFLGLKMLGALPFLARVKFKLPRFVSPKLINNLRGRGPFFVGLLNGFMPCGPLQTMQLYALGTGSLVMGALSMLIFSVGTVPLMFTFGAISGFFTKNWQQRLIRVSSILVVFFGVIMAGRALDLSGASGTLRTLVASFSGVSSDPLSIGGSSSSITGGSGSGGNSANVAVATMAGGVQTVSFDLQPGSYYPIAVQKGVPVKWTINASEDNLNGCNGEVTVPSLGISKKLQVGANLIEFTPTDKGQISYTCWMGMISSTIYVVDKLDAVAKESLGNNIDPTNLGNASPNSAVSNGASCCSGSNSPRFASGNIPTDQIQRASITTERSQQIQEVTITVDGNGYSPAVVILQRGIPARIKFNPLVLTSCNDIIEFPSYRGSLNLSQGQKETPLIPVTQDFGFQCGMNMLHGFVKVVDDLNKVDIDQVKQDVIKFQPAPGSGGGCCGG